MQLELFYKIEYVWVIPKWFGMELAVTQLAVKIRWDYVDNFFAREAEIMDIVYDLNKYLLRMFTFEGTFTKLSWFNVKLLFFYVPPGSIFILLLYIFRNIEKSLFITYVTKEHELDNQQQILKYLRLWRQKL